MDSITHLALGALTPLAFKNAPRLGVVALFGIVAGELPDLDILAGLSAEAMLVIHRGPTHSLPAILLFSLLLAGLFKLLLRRYSFRQPTVRIRCLGSREGSANSGVAGEDNSRESSASHGEAGDPGGNGRSGAMGGQWSLAVFNRPGDWALREIWLAALLALTLHVYLDCMTTFGTQILWPFSLYRVAIPALFIIDPVLTLPLLGVMFYCLFSLRKPEKQLSCLVWARRALIFAVFYPLFCLGVYTATSCALNLALSDSADTAEGQASIILPAQNSATAGSGLDMAAPDSAVAWPVMRAGGSAQDTNGVKRFRPDRILLTPMPLSPLYWKAVAVNESEYRLARSGPLELLMGRAPVFGRPYARVKADEWLALQNALPIFRAYAAFVSFPVVRETDSLTEITFEDLRYVPTGPEDLSNLGGRGQGMFLMQIRIREQDGALTAWRYLGRAGDAASAAWVEVNPLLGIFK